ncbi:MAG: AMP-binding protein [Bacteroidales bacterium]|uniref:AMP-binding protein n=1 Tax=Porphyromonas sp. TaxID=1924944 RepID=UPI002978E770|nr:AMP-binding protein [Porphyromonas sp.]MDD7438251.1 AMP-binding protein [Bacteroidales bacterium]MDY3067717.1 AMP-binding protein [Porphyromonas sp.]
MIKENFVKMYEKVFQENWTLPAFTNYEEAKTFTVADVAQWSAKVHLILEHNGIKKGDHVALIGKDCAEWCMIWMGIVTYGAVVVPILPDFHRNDILHILNHSESKLIFAGTEHQNLITKEEIPNTVGVFSIKDLKPVVHLCVAERARETDAEALFCSKYTNGFTRDDIEYPEIDNKELMVISYTSGTAGFSKGVMTTANNLAANIVYALTQEMQKRGDNLLCFLPNAHSYSCAFNFLLPLRVGAHVYILGQKPTPTVLLKALKDVRPRLILSVPLVLEKIYKSVLAPQLNSTKVKIALSTPILRQSVLKKFRQALIDALGGNVDSFIIGGAALNGEISDFLYSIKFPLTVGYGMTECAPLVSYCKPKDYTPGTCGRVLHLIEELRIADAQEIEGKRVGEIQIKGENVCLGYFKNEKATAELFTEDGWMKSGDLGYIEKDFVFLKGRSKAMLLGPNGQNIYPEEIEAKIAMLPFMNEAIVVQREGKKNVAIVTIDRIALEKVGHKKDKAIEKVLEENRLLLNQSISSFAQISAFEVLEGDFEKTPKQSIKRYLYS